VHPFPVSEPSEIRHGSRNAGELLDHIHTQPFLAGGTIQQITDPVTALIPSQSWPVRLAGVAEGEWPIQV
jgi:hypothetical protein